MNTPKKALIFFLILVVILVGGLSVYSRSKKNPGSVLTQTGNVQVEKVNTGESSLVMSSGGVLGTNSGAVEAMANEECNSITTNAKFEDSDLMKRYKQLVNVSEIDELKAEYRAVKELPLKTYNLSDSYYAGNEEGLLFMNLYSNGNLTDIDTAYSSKKIDLGSYLKLKSFVSGKDECGDDQNCRISFNIFTSIKENRFSFPTNLDMSHRMEFYVFKENKPQEYLENLQKLIVTECKKQIKK